MIRLLVPAVLALYVHTDALTTPVSLRIKQTASIHPIVNRQKLQPFATLHLSQSEQIAAEIKTPNAVGQHEPDGVNNDNNNSLLGAWIPLGSASSLADVTPTKIRVCGLDLAVWHNCTSKNEGGTNTKRKFSAFVDACPHRLAPLSQGRVDPSSNCLQCPYHGWEFSTDGELKVIPQLDDGQTISNELKKNGAATSLPVHAAGDLLFVFIPSDICGESWPIERLPEMHYPYLKNSMDTNRTYFGRDLPYSADFLIENFMDPAHIPFAHHSLQGTRDDGSPIKMELVASNFTHVEASFIDICRGKERDGVLSFQRPAFYHFRTKINATTSEYRPSLLIYVAPVQPGKCRVFIQDFDMPFLPTFLAHAGSNRFLNSDTWLHDTERYARLENNPMNKMGGSVAVGAAKAGKKPFVGLNYIFASQSDFGPSFFRRWWDKYLSESPPEFFGPAPPSAFSGEALSRAEQIDPWENHAKHCSKCRKSLKVIKRLKHVSVGVAATAAILLRRKPPVAIAAVFAGLWAQNFLRKLGTIIEGNNHRSEIDDRSVSATK